MYSEDPHFVSLSFGTISAVGANAAVIHYSTSEGNDATLSKDKIYLLDAGAQYYDCSTDVTRTHHFGTPRNEEIVIFAPQSHNKYFYLLRSLRKFSSNLS